jgi:phosphatidylserine decarboxylase
MRFAREGYPFIVPASAGAIVAFAWGGWVPGVAAAALLGFLLWFFRDPERRVPTEAGLVVAPADGRVIGIDSAVRVPEMTGPAARVSIFMSPLDVHVNRAPVSGRVTSVRYQPGRFHAAFSPKASPDNERNAIVIADERDERFLMVQIAGAMARRIVCYVLPEARVERGGRCGMILFGSRVDLYVPETVAVGVRVGDRLRAGESVVGVYRGASR